MKTQTVPITFKVHNMQADGSEYMQRSVELEPMDLHVVIELPLKKKYFTDPRIMKYWEEVKVAEVTGGNLPVFLTPSPIILTPAGLAEARRLVNDAFRPSHSYTGNDEDEELQSYNEYDEF